MTQSNSKETAEIVGQAHRLPVRGRQAERPPYNQKEEMALGLRWWSVQQSFVERDRTSGRQPLRQTKEGETLRLWQR